MKKKLLWLWLTTTSLYLSPVADANTESAVAHTTSHDNVRTIAPAAIERDKASPSAPIIYEEAPSRNVILSFAQIAPAPGNMLLRGIAPNGMVTFDRRNDEVVSKAVLNLEYTPSPSLLPVQSQLKVYLNDELIGVLPVTKEQLGQKTVAQIPIDSRYIADFNKIGLEFIGHYRDICENPANTTLWMDIGRGSHLDIDYQKLMLKNDLAYFPAPFFDARDNSVLTLPMIFPDTPDLKQQQAAGIIASWFGAKAQWRGQQFPAYYNQLPDRNAVVFATNSNRPSFLKEHPDVSHPTVEMISHPDNPYVKLLVIFGRDDSDLLLAARGIAQGNLLFRGQSVTVDNVEALQPRQPYDAPNWLPTNRPVTLGELKTYPEQLQSNGIVPAPISVMMVPPPDLFSVRHHGIDLDLKYRYTAPVEKDSSRLSVSVNNEFVQAVNLTPGENGNQLFRLQVLQGLLDKGTDITIPALRLGSLNQLSFNFNYMNPMPGGTVDNCITYQPVPNHVVIEDNSTINFSNYHHFIAMPDLSVFAKAGFPFSRMADLSQTLIVISPKPQQAEVTTLLNTLGLIGAQTGFPALNFTLTNDGQKVPDTDADILIIGSIPSTLKDDKNIALLINATENWVKTPVKQTPLLTSVPNLAESKAAAKTTITAEGPMAAILSFQSPHYAQRTVLALLADSSRGYTLLNEAMNDTGKRNVVAGSVTIIRESGVNALRVGDIYYVGHLPWFERLWFALSNHPVLMSVFAVIGMILLGWLLWLSMKVLSRRRITTKE